LKKSWHTLLDAEEIGGIIGLATGEKNGKENGRRGFDFSLLEQKRLWKRERLISDLSRFHRENARKTSVFVRAHTPCGL
jgi:hypothetical protein